MRTAIGLLAVVWIGVWATDPTSEGKGGDVQAVRGMEAPLSSPSGDPNDTERKAVNSGFVFDQGRYVPPPYLVTRKGFDIFINDIPVRDRNMAWLAAEAGRHGLVNDPDVQQQCNNVRREYEEYLQEGCAYLLFSDGQQLRLDPDEVAYTLPEIVHILRSDMGGQAKVKAMTKIGWQFGLSAGNLSVLGDCFAASQQLDERLEAQAEARLFASDLGISEAEPIDTGFVFLRGEYVDAPYTVTRRGRGIFINNELVSRPWLSWPAGEVPEKDPPVPSEITRWTSKWDKVLGDFFDRKATYAVAHLSPSEERTEMERTFCALPCVSDAHLDPEGSNILRITTFRGEEDSILLVGARGRRPPSDKRGVLQQVEDRRTVRENSLRKGECCFIGPRGGEISLSPASVPRLLPHIVEILCSARSAAEKREALQQEALKDVSPDTVAELVANFKCSEQLKQRVSLLRSTE